MEIETPNRPYTSNITFDNVLSEPLPPEYSKVNWSANSASESALLPHQHLRIKAQRRQYLKVQSSLLQAQVTKGEAQHVDLQRPTPFSESDGYVMRLAAEQETESNKEKIGKTTNLSKASTAEEEAQIRALKRKKGEEEKRKRIEAVKKQLALGGGGGAKIRSSLMGIGGQDREKVSLERAGVGRRRFPEISRINLTYNPSTHPPTQPTNQQTLSPS